MSDWRRFLYRSYYLRRLEASTRFLGLPLSKSDRQILSLKNTAKENCCFIIGNGPSLDAADLDVLKDHPCFASNKIFLIFGKTDWRPTYFAISDEIVYKRELRRICQEQLGVKLVRKTLNRENVEGFIKFRTKYVPLQRGGSTFQTNPLRGFYDGGTICFHMIQIAYFIGYRKMFLLGVDFNYGQSKVNNPKVDVLTQVRPKESCDHFSKDYYQIGENWIPPDLEQQGLAFDNADNFLRKNGGFLKNASRRTALTRIERVGLEEALESSWSG